MSGFVQAFSVPYLPSSSICMRKPYHYEKEPLVSWISTLCYKGEWNWVALTNPVLFMCHGCRVGMTFESMTVNDNVTDSNAPVTLGSTQSGQWSIHDTRGFFGPPTPTYPSTTLTSPYCPCLSDWINPYPPHTWLLTLSFSDIIHSVELQVTLSQCYFKGCFFIMFRSIASE